MGHMKDYVLIPESVAKALEEAGYKHVERKLNDTPFRWVLHLRDDGSTCLKFGESWLDSANLKVNTPVTVQLAPDLEPNRVNLPIELLAELQREPQIMEVFSELSISKQKTLAYGVEWAKKLETRIRRSQAIELREMLEGDAD
jgi:hypothetical protein